MANLEKMGYKLVMTFGIDQPLAKIKTNSSVRYYQTDALGSVIALTDETGTIMTQYAYDLFGSVAITGEASDNPFQYTGRENDNTGLYYYRARYYDPGMQRCISEDPIGLAGGINKFGYIHNRPTIFVDPLGLWTFSIGVDLSGYLSGFGGGGGTALNIGYSERQGFSFSITGMAGGGAAGLIGGGLGISISGTNASSVNQLLGTFVQGTRGLGPTATLTGFTGEGVQGGGLTFAVLGDSPYSGASVTTTSAIFQFAGGTFSIGNSGNGSIWSSGRCK